RACFLLCCAARFSVWLFALKDGRRAPDALDPAAGRHADAFLFTQGAGCLCTPVTCNDKNACTSDACPPGRRGPASTRPSAATTATAAPWTRATLPRAACTRPSSATTTTCARPTHAGAADTPVAGCALRSGSHLRRAARGQAKGCVESS